MLTLLGMPQGAEWFVILAIVMLLFGSAKLPALVRQLGRSKKIWEEELGAYGNKPDGELGADARSAERSTDGQLPAEPPPDHRG